MTQMTRTEIATRIANVSDLEPNEISDEVIEAFAADRNITVTQAVKLSENATKLFRLYAIDAANWGGEPIFNANVTLLSEKRDSGLLLQLKKAGLVETVESRNRINGRVTLTVTIRFTGKGAAFAEEIGLEVRRDTYGGYWFSEK